MAPLRLRTADLSIARTPPHVDPFYLTEAWRQTRARIFARDGYRCTVPGCQRPAQVCDHIVSRRSGGSDADTNLRSLCDPHDRAMKENHLGERRGQGRVKP